MKIHCSAHVHGQKQKSWMRELINQALSLTVKLFSFMVVNVLWVAKIFLVHGLVAIILINIKQKLVYIHIHVNLQ